MFIFRFQLFNLCKDIFECDIFCICSDNKTILVILIFLKALLIGFPVFFEILEDTPILVLPCVKTAYLPVRLILPVTVGTFVFTASLLI